MMRGLCIIVLAVFMTAAQNQVSADDDPRTTISLPPEVEAGVLAEMRAHMANLDDIVAALAEGDFKQAAWVADIRMTFGHRRWADMAEGGATEEEIAAAKARFKEKRESQSGQMSVGMGMGPGFGRFMPEDFRAMGALFHEAAESFAQTARSVATPASPADYRSVLEGLQEVTTACRGCHDAFRIEPSR